MDSGITNTISNVKDSFSTSEVWMIISILLAVIGGIYLFNTYFSKEKKDSYKGIKKAVYEFINFKITIIEPLFKVLYLITAIAITLTSLSYITENFFKFIAILVFGNIIARLTFEFFLLILKMFKDVSEINDKIKQPKKNIKKEDIEEN